MTLVKDARALYARAYEERFAMPAFNVCNLEMAQGVLEAAEEERAGHPPDVSRRHRPRGSRTGPDAERAR